jgi:hypothetical protein
MIASLISYRRSKAIFLSIAFALATSSLRVFAADAAADEDRENCKKNLTTLYKAIKAYRADNKDLPPWLSDLVPKYLKDPNTLICPVIKKTGEVKNFGIEDPKISTAYTYEFADTPIPAVIQGGSSRTMKEWKRRQMGLVGSKVPMVRCHNHGRVLNLSFDGRIFDSEGGWEAELKDEVDPADLTPARVFASDTVRAITSKAQAQIPPRDAATPANLIDLSRYYNAALTESWHRNSPSEPVASDLSWLPRGQQKFGEVEFDTRGLIQLSSRTLGHPRFAPFVKNIKVEQKASRIHFLMGTGWSTSEGSLVASFVMHYANGEQQQFNVLYGIHVLDWVSRDAEPRDTKASMIAWTGRSPATDNQAVLHIYKTVWTNPTPNEPITAIDFLGSGADPAPFLIAITAEKP